LKKKVYNMNKSGGDAVAETNVEKSAAGPVTEDHVDEMGELSKNSGKYSSSD
jgi:hypothetical protein